jgi:GT2 family glycosyltransferase
MMSVESSVDLISVVMPVHNGVEVLDRSISSLRRQTFAEWELVAVDDCSTDGSYESLISRIAKDSRIRVMRTSENRGPSAARNLGMRQAAGRTIVYLDCDDVYYSDYLENVDHFRRKADVLIFGYDVVDDDDPERSIRSWDPTPYKNVLFAGNIATPLGVAHSRDLALQVGAFDEDLWGLEDWDLWKRLARAGAEFLFLPLRSGLYHKRKSSRSSSPRLTEKQRVTFESRLASGGSLYAEHGQPQRNVQRILLLSSIFPFGSLSPAARDFAEAGHSLGRSGFGCQSFCTSKLGKESELEFERTLSGIGLPLQTQYTTLGPHAARMIYTRAGDIPASIFRTDSTRLAEYRDGECAAVLDYFERFLLKNRPDAMIACNPEPKPDIVFDLLFHVGKACDIPMVLWLGDGTPINLTVMQNIDYPVVTSEFLRRRYWDSIGLVCKLLPRAFDWEHARVPCRDPKLVFVLASDSTGESLVSAKIVERLGRTRPDIPVVTLGQDWKIRGPADGICATPATRFQDVERPLTPSDVYSAAKILVVPALGHELFDRTVAEAMINGIPVVISNRGALPELVESAALVLDIPACYQPRSTQTPRADDISHWVECIVRLWDDRQLYTQFAGLAVNHSRCWHPSRTAPIYEEFFRNLCPQPGPPLLPRWSDKSLSGFSLFDGNRRQFGETGKPSLSPEF